ncbi:MULTISPECIES: hypothetical protein [unclassified Burkholderia]|uniref:hypothetical protein n=1 Tax=unclassified Burkholderia TaxID=2613784 RepID=UPI00141ECD85|nr:MULTISPECIES: hypothetical protein [unclassified Burkholderia]NIE57779.1 hypothetical protein [Burkholderia sp. Ap-955]NIF10776.1 hypothetical protein [Burkholderia sp. Ax-1735]NIG02500.1 hypothetical protein [Burkholderia sp. Tr-849]
MNNRTAWETAAEAQGTTESERVLTRLARKAFLSLWSYPNVYSDEGRVGGKGDGKELVDLLIVFGNDVLLFSDKHCMFQSDVDIKIAWRRWYKRAIEKSARQLAGAEGFLRRFPDRIFVDKTCQTKLPVALPDSSVARYFLIAVTRGGHDAARRYFGGGSSGSIMLNNTIDGEAHYAQPFEVGYPLGSRRFVHVLDEVTVDTLLEELDTVPDLVDYLACKERYFGTNGVFVHIAGEEELLARYVCTMDEDRHTLPEIPTGAASVLLLEGDWRTYSSSPQRAAKREADRGSYMWDALIEYQASFVRAGTAVGFPGESADTIDHERILRALAAERRQTRRELAEHFRFALSKSEPGKKFARMVLSSGNKSAAYVFLTMPKPSDIDYEEYREIRTASLLAYCHGIKQRFPFVTEAVGIASEPVSEAISSQDFLYVDLTGELSAEEAATWKAAMEELDVFQTPPEDLTCFATKDHEFPLPFEFQGPSFYEYGSGIPMNRAERRRMAREVRREAKQSNKRKR